MENLPVSTVVSTPELEIFAYSPEYARSKKTGSHYWMLDLIFGLLLLSAVGVAFLLRNVIPVGSPVRTPFIIGLMAAVLIIYFIFRGALHHRTDAWFCSFARRDGRLYHLEFTARQGAGIFGTILDPVHNQSSINAACDPDVIDTLIACKQSGDRMPASSAYRSVEITELNDPKLTVSGKKLIISYTDGKGRQRKLVTADCFESLIESMQ